MSLQTPIFLKERDLNDFFFKSTATSEYTLSHAQYFRHTESSVLDDDALLMKVESENIGDSTCACVVTTTVALLPL
jgi:hypothetical protein|eukprot:CAMPEP_0202493134 /NCGR_PEP_ID=MMETSP1361-20130828/9582_1 /ASSEMBLY_ACC=CAM_ASM_000849 /TAXON_ID=210615 /ORGANISM="Staurosira complex sp., Strain CCMP2646" /LENGTH=75 /DNA_ID=CAMNT_0049123409 /DNA_START=609 /DNA_END=836 /DNA_ORIENTATION=-